jgi:hypothetical protein
MIYFILFGEILINRKNFPVSRKKLKLNLFYHKRNTYEFWVISEEKAVKKALKSLIRISFLASRPHFRRLVSRLPSIVTGQKFPFPAILSKRRWFFKVCIPFSSCNF